MAEEEILTGEGVSLQISAASVIARAAAWLIDAIATGVVALIAVLVLDRYAAGRFDEASAKAAVLILAAVLLVGAPTIVETFSHGRSLGKLALGLQVIRDDGGPVRLRHAAVRALLGWFELWLLLGGLAFIVSMLNNRGKRVGDYLAGTYVVQLRAPRSSLAPLLMPPELAGWVRVTDIRTLPDGLALRARQFLARADQFPPQVRDRLGLRLAAQIELYVSPAAPDGVHQERFMAAVLLERRRREELNLAREQPRLAAQLSGLTTLPYGVADPEV